MNRLWIAVLGVLVACAGQQQNEVLVQNVGFAQGSTYNVQYMSPNAVNYQWSPVFDFKIKHLEISGNIWIVGVME